VIGLLSGVGDQKYRSACLERDSAIGVIRQSPHYRSRPEVDYNAHLE